MLENVTFDCSLNILKQVASHNIEQMFSYVIKTQTTLNELSINVTWRIFVHMFERCSLLAGMENDGNGLFLGTQNMYWSKHSQFKMN